MADKAASVRLRHVTFVTSGIIFAPEGGTLKVEKGVVTIPLDRPLAVLSAWYDGYRIDDETGEEIRSVEAFLAAKAEDPDDEPQEPEEDPEE